MMNAPFHPPPWRPGISNLLTSRRVCLLGRRIGLVSHLAAVDETGQTTAARLQADPDLKLAALFGPEHGFTGQAAAGEHTPDGLHPLWKIPIHSLYGHRRRPLPDSFQQLDLLLIDLQDLGARPYTYVSTLRACLEVAAETHRPVMVADRPIPLPQTLDGPLLDPACASFVGAIPSPLLYGMTPGETARWLVTRLGLDLDLTVAPMENYRRPTFSGTPDWSWIPPSPRIRSLAAAQCFTATVFSEGLAAIDNGTGLEEVFQVVGSGLADPRVIHQALAAIRLPGVRLNPCNFTPTQGPWASRSIGGARIQITDAARFQPVTLSVHLIAAFQAACGAGALWSFSANRPAFFDQLYGTPSVRVALQTGHSPDHIVTGWQPDLAAFASERASALLYEAAP
jgi:uncharacterized protein YbbC (DUF1343 family)